MKLAAIIGRGTRKDYVDLYFILQQASLEDLFKIAAVKYARVRTFAISATRALAYFGDAQALPMPRMLTPVLWTQMKKFLEKQALEAGRERLEDLWEWVFFRFIHFRWIAHLFFSIEPARSRG